MKVMLIGGAGFIGAYVAKKLVEQGDEVVIYDNFSNYVDPFKSRYSIHLNKRFPDGILSKLKLVRGDVRHKTHLFRTMKEHKPEVVVHLAALPIATKSDQFAEDAIDINLIGTTNVLEIVRETDSVKRFVYTSSSMVYGNFQYGPADEEHPKKPLGVYGATKYSGELLTKAYGKQYGIEYVVIRPSSVYGPTDVNRRVSQIFIENALQGKTLILHNGGLSKLDFTFVEDIAEGFVLAIKSEKAANQVFNITRGRGRSLKEFAEEIKKHIPDVKIEYQELPANEKRPERGALDISKAKKLLGYEPKYDIEEGIKIYIDYLKGLE